jgi:hypothetical protein
VRCSELWQFPVSQPFSPQPPVTQAVGRLNVIPKSKEEILITSATLQKRQDLMVFIEHELVSEPAVQAVVGTRAVGR